jgi:SAM-dependent methyltransferase
MLPLLKNLAKTILSAEQRQQVRKTARRAANFGFARYCPWCGGHLRRFVPFGLIPRPEAKCPVCNSLERHRLIYLYLTQRTTLFDRRPKKLLHIAPEPQLAALFKSTASIDYLSADLFSPDAMVKMDITDIQYPDNTFDAIYCSHVLEHVLDDRKAMREFCRVLKPDGWAILMVPITADVTFEDATVTSPEERERLFGQHDHVRRYGPDYKDRLTEAGFNVKVDGFAAELDVAASQRVGLIRGDEVYLCTKRPT